MRTLLRLLTLGALLSAGSVAAQGISIIQGSDGTSGTVIDLGGGLRSYSDSHGNMGTIMDLGGGLQTFQFSAPHGGLQSGTILTLPSPRSNFDTPSAGLTPAPVLPFASKGPLMPRERMAPVAPWTPVSPGAGAFGGGSGKPGR
jgi:hypothetical protein